VNPRLRKRIVRPLLVMLGAIGVFALYIVATNNFHTVIDGELYRSARPSAAQVAEWHERYGIKTIINLMGAHPKAAWYREEKAAAEANGITMIDHQMSAQRDVPAGEVETLLDILSKAERPILVHCRSGADRTGIAGGSELYAEFQLTPFFGHLPFGFLRSYAMDRSFERAETRLGFRDS